MERNHIPFFKNDPKPQNEKDNDVFYSMAENGGISKALEGSPKY